MIFHDETKRAEYCSCYSIVNETSSGNGNDALIVKLIIDTRFLIWYASCFWFTCDSAFVHESNG